MSVEVCQVCLATGVRLHQIDSALRQQLQALMGIQVGSVSSRYDCFVCYECYALLNKSRQLRERSFMSQSLLLGVVRQFGMVTKEAIESVDRASSGLVSSLTVTRCAPEICMIYDETEDSCRIEDSSDDEAKTENSANDAEMTDSVRRDGPSVPLLPLDPLKTEDDASVILDDENARNPDVIVIDEHTSNFVPSISKRFSDAMLNELYPYLKAGMYPVRITHTDALEQMRLKSEYVLRESFNYKCELCFMPFYNREAYNHHMMAEHDPRIGQWSCKYCHVRFPSKHKCVAHYRTAHLNKYHCQNCDFVCYTLSTATEHFQTHGDVVFRFKCNFCTAGFNTKSLYNLHVYKYHCRKFICNMCGRDYCSRRGLNMHKSGNHQETKHVKESDVTYCEDCEFCFTNSEALERHRIVSSKHNPGNTINGCCICLKSFPTLPQLMKHQMASHGRWIKPWGGTYRLDQVRRRVRRNQSTAMRWRQYSNNTLRSVAYPGA